MPFFLWIPWFFKEIHVEFHGNSRDDLPPPLDKPSHKQPKANLANFARSLVERVWSFACDPAVHGGPPEERTPCVRVHLLFSLNQCELLNCSADTIHALTAASTPVAKVERKHFAYPAYHRHTVGIPIHQISPAHASSHRTLLPNLRFKSRCEAILCASQVHGFTFYPKQNASKVAGRWYGLQQKEMAWDRHGRMAAWPLSKSVLCIGSGTNGTNGTSESNGPSTSKYNKSVSAK